MQCDCYILRGDIYFLEYDKAHEGYGDCYGYNYGGGNANTYQGVKVGNAVIQINLQQNQLVKVSREGLDFTGCAYPDLTGSTVEIGLLCTSQKNLNLALRGVNNTTASTAGSVVDEIYSSPCQDGFEADSFIRFTNPVTKSTVVLKRSDTLATLVLGIDYTLTEIGFVLLRGLPANVNVLATYTSVVRTIDSIQAFLGTVKTYRITVIGENVSAEDDETYIYTFKKVRLSALNNAFDVLNEDFPELNFNGAILRDRLVGVNESPFLTVEKITS